MNKDRLLAFCDGVFAILITILVLNLKPPIPLTPQSLIAVAPDFASYALSFLLIGIYWNNHHHMFQLVRYVNGAIMWGNLGLLFWLSFLPFTTACMAGSHFSNFSVSIYGVNMLLAALSWGIVARALRAHHGPTSQIARAYGKDHKAIFSTALNAFGIVLSHWSAILGMACYITINFIWMVPDRRVEKVLAEHHANSREPVA